MTQKVLTHCVGIFVVGLVLGCLFAPWTAEGINGGIQGIASNKVDFFAPGSISPRSLKARSQQQDRPVEQTRKNIQVLKGLPDSQLFSVMNFMRGSLGVSCAYCHVHNEGGDKWEWEKDDKPAKRAARRMMQMVIDINKTNFNGAQPVTCYTCHRGEEARRSAPSAADSARRGRERHKARRLAAHC
jgi:hypothetical protein